ncbi:M10 family metallopeptidase [Pseudophaeobacter sp.]|uniref:M10 family metallopeptidase n=1 Tax=Pseudophaeobacter sp. TaxID=1971739 RepID=UPI0032968B65
MCEFCGIREHRLFVDGTTSTPTVEAVAAPKPTYTVDQVADFLTEGYWGGTSRSFSVGADREISVNLSGLTLSAQAVARTALDSWAAVSGLNFVETNSSAEITFDDADARGAYNSSLAIGGRIYTSDINIPTSWAAYGDYYLQTFIHEIGHALGLGHSGNYNGSATYEKDAAFANDSWQMSIMSYFDQDEATGVNASFSYVWTPQVADIAAIQNLYGVPTNVETGDTTYGDGNTTGRSILDLDLTRTTTIVDSGGIDTINLGSRAFDQKLSLIVDTFSDLNGKTGNFAIGRGTVIENAITGSGNDTINGNAANNHLQSGGGNDLINAGDGDDTVLGGSGSDSISGGIGNDSLYGGTGHDTYFVDSYFDRVIEEAGEGTDSVLSSSSYSLRRSSNHVENLTLLGTLDLFGFGNGQANSIAGNSGDNLLNGAWGNDTLIGGAGDDTFQDDNGADLMFGGTGNDIYYVDHAGDRIVELAGQGNDLIFVGSTFALRDVSNAVENLSLSGTADINGTGNGLHNKIYGNSGNNILNGAWGNDTLFGGAGNDTFQDDNGADAMHGGAGNDVYYVDNAGDQVFEGPGQGRDRVVSSVNFSLRDHSQHIEVLTLTGAAQLGTGNGLDNIIYGNATLQNLLNGAWGDDTLYGGQDEDTFRDDGGADLMVGGDGWDIYYVDNVGDRIIEHAGAESGVDGVRSTITVALRDLSQNLEELYLLGSDNLNGTGNGKDNYIDGNSGDNILNGAWGDDDLHGRAGNDTFRDDGGNDTMTGGADADTFVLFGAFGNDTIMDFDVNEAGEVIDLSGLAAITDFSDLAINHLSEVDGNTVISDGLGNSVTLVGVANSDLTLDDFVF